MLNLISRNEDICFAYPGGTISSEEHGVYLVASSFPDVDELTAANMWGKKFITSSGTASSTSYVIWKRVTELPGGEDIKPTDITFEAGKLPEMPLVLKGGAADGSQVISPYHNKLVGDDCCVVFPRAYPTTAPQAGYLVGSNMSERKDVVAAFFRATSPTPRTCRHAGSSTRPTSARSPGRARRCSPVW